MDAILEAIQSGASGEDIAHLPLPESYRAAYVHRDDTAMFEGIDSWDKDPRKSLRVGDVDEDPERTGLGGPDKGSEMRR